MGHMSYFLNFNIFLSLKIVFILANSADPDEMSQYVTFHLFLQFAKISVYQVSRMKRIFHSSQTIFGWCLAALVTLFPSY